jgi:hypothetical protein
MLLRDAIPVLATCLFRHVDGWENPVLTWLSALRARAQVDDRLSGACGRPPASVAAAFALSTLLGRSSSRSSTKA